MSREKYDREYVNGLQVRKQRPNIYLLLTALTLGSLARTLGTGSLHGVSMGSSAAGKVLGGHQDAPETLPIGPLTLEQGTGPSGLSFLQGARLSPSLRTCGRSAWERS